MNKKPIHFLVLKIIGCISIITAIVGIILTVNGFGDFESNNFMIGGIITTSGIFLGIPCLVIGFQPEITKVSVKSKQYIQQENKENLTDIANTQAEILQGAITKTTAAVKNGLDEDKMYCKHCGKMIDADSKYCSKCGKEQ